VRRSGKIDLIRIEDIRYIQGAGSYSELHLRDGSTELHDKSLDRLLAVLPPDFERIHKSYIVPMSEMKCILVHEGSRYEAELHDGSVLPVGRTRLRQIRKKLRA
jgi:DNA-binding LytR/AlgR family response regulator